MPAHFTHIYAERRVADHLANGRPSGWTGPGPSGVPNKPTPPIFDKQKGVGKYAPDYCAGLLVEWEKFAAIGAIGPDLLYASQDYAAKLPAPINAIPPSDEIMLALAVYFYYRTNVEDDYEPLLIILDKVDSTMGAIVRFLIKLEKIWKDFLKTWTSTIGPFVNAANSALDDLTGGLISEFGVGIDQLKTALITLVEEELLSVKDIFAGFDTCVAKGWDDQSFVWGDTLHYRRTSGMARALIEQAERIRVDDPAHPERFEQALSFAMGWISHVGLDTIGHAFVNEQCGGPFRNHPQRHHLIENHIDAWNYRKTAAGGTLTPDSIGATPTNPDISLAGLGFAVQMTEANPTGKHRPATLPEDDPVAAKAALTTDGQLPGWVADAIVGAMIETYGGEPAEPNGRHTHPEVYGGSDFQNLLDGNKLTQAIEDVTGHGPDKPLPLLLADIVPTPGFTVPHGFPLPWQIQVCYRLVMTLYNLTYTGSWDLDKPRKPPFIIVPPASDIENLLSPPDFSGASSGDPVEDVCNAVKALVDWITKELDAALKLVGDLVKMLASPGSYLLRLGLYELAMMVWDVTQKVHEMLAHMGFFMPHGETHYPDGELRLGNEIDELLVTLGGTVDAAFQGALADALDPFANLDHRTEPIVGHPIPDGAYPYYMVAEYDDQNAKTPSRDAGKLVTAEYKRPWAYPAFAYNAGNLIPNPSELSGGSVTSPIPVGQAAPIPGPYPLGDTPDLALFRLGDPDPEALKNYETSLHPQDTDVLNRRYIQFDEFRRSPLGDAIPFGCYLIGRILNDRSYDTHFNLDADRAYGYLTWDWLRDGPLIDADLPGVTYVPPVTPPQMAVDTAPPPPPDPPPHQWNDPLNPLLMEYIDLP